MELWIMVVIIPLQYEHRPSNSFSSLGFHDLHLMCHLSSWGKWCSWIRNTSYTMTPTASCHKFNGWRFKSSGMCVPCQHRVTSHRTWNPSSAPIQEPQIWSVYGLPTFIHLDPSYHMSCNIPTWTMHWFYPTIVHVSAESHEVTQISSVLDVPIHVNLPQIKNFPISCSYICCNAQCSCFFLIGSIVIISIKQKGTAYFVESYWEY